MTDALLQFRDAIRSTGLEPPDSIEQGTLHRFPGAGKGPSNRAGWCKLFDDCVGGCLGTGPQGSPGPSSRNTAAPAHRRRRLRCRARSERLDYKPNARGKTGIRRRHLRLSALLPVGLPQPAENLGRPSGKTRRPHPRQAGVGARHPQRQRLEAQGDALEYLRAIDCPA